MNRGWGREFLGGLWFLQAAGFTAALHAVTNSPPEDKIPPLRPPRAEIPPGFWELYTGWVVAGVLVLGALVALLAWWLTRSKPVAVLPPVAQAKAALAPLAAQPETGQVLSRVSQVLRRYVAATFGLPEGEMTTADLGREMSTKPEIKPEIAGSVNAFLRECDERKFAPGGTTQPLGAVSRANALIESVEECRAELARRADESQAGQPAGTAPGQAPEGGEARS